MTPNIMYATWASEKIKNTQLSKSLHLFYHRLPTENHELDKIYGDDIDKILNEAADNNSYDWVVVQKEGTLYESQTQLVNDVKDFILEELIPNNIFVAGQLINKKNQYCGLHEQFMIINLDIYRKWDRPIFGGYLNNETMDLCNYEYGPSLHDDYTPLFIKPKESTSTYSVKMCGWNFVHTSLKKGFDIVNIPESIRFNKVFMYPDENTEILLKNVNNIFNTFTTPNISQNRALLYLYLKKIGLSESQRNAFCSYKPKKACFFAYNTEHLNPDPAWIARNKSSLAHVVAPCSGFLAFANSYNFGITEKTKVTYYDVNPYAVLYKKYFNEVFDGDVNKISQLIDNFLNNNPEAIIADNSQSKGQKNLLKEFDDSSDKLHQFWSIFNKTEKDYKSINLLENWESLTASLINSKEPALLCISDIFSGTNELVYSSEYLYQRFYDMINMLSKNENIIIEGKSPDDIFFIDYAHNVFNKLKEESNKFHQDNLPFRMF